ncbi:MAG: alpha/beta fold hydrolase [Ramlibacter sp.]|nr:alpha/beta fold hydrolase [Ramlibacter sp.]
MRQRARTKRQPVGRTSQNGSHMARPRSAIAHLQQLIVLVLLAAASGWLAGWWDRSRWIGCAGFAFIVLGYSGFLALEFLALHFVDRGGASSRPTWGALVRAWAGETLQGPRVFLWRQPFRWREVPDRITAGPQLQGRRGVVFIHGFVCNRGFWTPWLKRVTAEGRAFSAVNLEPLSGPIDAYVPIVERAVAAVTQASGLSPVLVCHSMGGLAARAWLRAHGAGRVHHIVTIATPHHGTWLARFGHTANGRQMRVGSDWLRALGHERTNAPATGFTCWYSDCDNIVFPTATATLPEADNRLVRGVAHVDLAFRPEVIRLSLALLEDR